MKNRGESVIATMVDTLRASRLRHRAGSCWLLVGNDREQAICACGAEEHNARIDAALALADGIEQSE